MSTTQSLDALNTCLSFFALLALWFFGWRRYALDTLRQDLYAARDRLFDLADENPSGAFSFDHPTYGQLRRQLHGAIRYAHRVSTLGVLVFWVTQWLIGPRVKVGDGKKWFEESILNRVDCAAQPAMVEVSQMWDRALMFFLLRTSPLFILCVALLVVVAIIKALFTMMLNKLVVKTEVRAASANFSRVVWAEVAMEDAIAEQRGEGCAQPA